VASATAAAQQLGTIRFDSWLSYQRNDDGSARRQYDPRLFVPFDLQGGWIFTQRADLPVLYTDKVGSDNPEISLKRGNALAPHEATEGKGMKENNRWARSCYG